MHNDPQDFPELNFHHLVCRAMEWAIKLTPGLSDLPIERVVLYQYNPLYKAYHSKPIWVKYAVAFEFYNTDEYTDDVFNEATPKNGTIKEIIERISDEKNASNAVKKYKEFVWHTRYYQTVGSQYPAFINESFSRVYKQSPGDDLISREWIFFAKPPKEKLPKNFDRERPYWVLWKKGDEAADNHRPIDDKPKSARDEILHYVKQRHYDSNPLNVFDFQNETNKTIVEICRKHNVGADTLRRYATESPYFKTSKRGRKSK